MPATPDENDVPDLFTDSAGQSDEEILANSRMQVGLVVGTGVLVIVITALVVVLMGHNGQSIADGPNRPVGITSNLLLPPIPTPAPATSTQPSESPVPTRSVTQTPSQTKKPPTTPPPTTAGPIIATLASLSCDRTSILVGETSNCTIELSSAAHTALTVNLGPQSSSCLTIPPEITLDMGSKFASFTVEGKLFGGTDAVTATLDGVTKSSAPIQVTLLA